MRSFLLLGTLILVGACAESQPAGDTDAGAAAQASASAGEANGAAGEASGAAAVSAGRSSAADAEPDAVGRGESGLIFNTPEGGALDWLADIDAGLDAVPSLVGSDPGAAQTQVLNLYVTRQEYLEGYYGPGGRLETTPELAEAIKTNEARFHVLMQELAKEAPDSARAVALTDSLSAQVSRVRTIAESVDRELNPRSGADS